ncbi:Endonuclease YncB, thermonuclease family [Pseudomonas delhiensis]|uniref:Endonuclease YncB, thermonuclease family n=1 Tax=Pseudomonas delhiensis TaxID=366289 RepID=A0A239K4Z0_9PSED|nr:thermonuclease family protein [Pseudomonas delhiensis]SDJ00986.1 Endonuclease YncB, thermonuclease family [Pseudomonas delhiensis]SNT12699.1 Endonuclease YncB, thermonuclease family [Pseudomonas delhiensis]
MRLPRPALLFILALPAVALADGPCQVTAVASGDRLTCRLAERSVEVRLRGVEAPRAGEPYAQASLDNLQRLALGRGATLVLPREEAAGALSAAVWVEPADCPGCGHTLDVGRAQLSVGMARWRVADAQGEEERAQYNFEEQEARARKVGLWRPAP